MLRRVLRAPAFTSLTCLAACSSSAPPPPDAGSSAPPPPAAVVAPSSPAPRTEAAGPPPCGDPDPGTPALTDFQDVEAGRRFWVDVAHDERAGEWLPVASIRMPHHHASRIEWRNLDAFPAIAAARSGRLRFFFVVTARDVRQVPGRHEWRATYTATLTDVCALAP
jgi:hypothetical protein